MVLGAHRVLYPLLTCGREREGVDRSALKLTAYTIEDTSDPTFDLGLAIKSGSIRPTKSRTLSR